MFVEIRDLFVEEVKKKRNLQYFYDSWSDLLRTKSDISKEKKRGGKGEERGEKQGSKSKNKKTAMQYENIVIMVSQLAAGRDYCRRSTSYAF